MLGTLGRTPRSAADAPVGPPVSSRRLTPRLWQRDEASRADQGVRPGSAPPAIMFLSALRSIYVRARAGRAWRLLP
jgi:hypothetical protein